MFVLREISADHGISALGPAQDGHHGKTPQPNWIKPSGGSLPNTIGRDPVRFPMVSVDLYPAIYGGKVKLRTNCALGKERVNTAPLF